MKGEAFAKSFLCLFLTVFLLVFPVALSEGGKNAQLAVIPGSGKAGTAITIGGTGFEANETVELVVPAGSGIFLGLGTAKVEAIIADSAGAFSVKSAIPRVLKPGVYPLNASGSKGSRAEIRLVVTK